MNSLARHFNELMQDDPQYRQWTAVLLDYHAASSSAAPKPPRLAALLPRVRTSPVCVLRKGTRLASFEGKVPSMRTVEEWLGGLKMGEVPWSTVDGL